MGNKDDDGLDVQIEDPSDTRTEVDSYNKVLLAQLARIDRIIPVVAKSMMKRRSDLLILYAVLRSLDGSLIPLRRDWKREGTPLTSHPENISVRVLSLTMDEAKIRLLDELLDWKDDLMKNFAGLDGVRAPRRVMLRDTGEIVDAP